MKIGQLDLEKGVMVVAEIGNNHEGGFELAKKFIGLAAKSGVPAVKFQTIYADQFTSRKNTQRYEALKRFELSDSQYAALAQTERDEGVLFISRPSTFSRSRRDVDVSEEGEGGESSPWLWGQRSARG